MFSQSSYIRGLKQVKQDILLTLDGGAVVSKNVSILGQLLDISNFLKRIQLPKRSGSSLCSMFISKSHFIKISNSTLQAPVSLISRILLTSTHLEMFRTNQRCQRIQTKSFRNTCKEMHILVPLQVPRPQLYKNELLLS